MANSEVPSFSLGLDLALDTPPHSPINPPLSPAPHVSDSDPETRPDPPRPILKRLRRGPPPPPFFDADEIEEFSSEDDPDQVHALPSAWNRSVCSTSKVSLNGSGVLTPHSCSNSRERKRKEASDDVPASARLETGKSGLMFPKLTTSPLRRFQLLDSDSDDSYVDLDVGGADEVNPNSHLEQNKKTSFDANGNQDLWKDFLPGKNVSVPTPAFNELCEEYFRSAKCKEVRGDVNESHNERYPGVSSSCHRDQQQQWESTDPVHPAHRYFFHEDLRIQQLVRCRLQNFNPLGVVNRVNQQPNVSHIDYMGQFGNGGASNMQGVQNGCVNSSTRGKNKSSNLGVGVSFNASGGWVDPKIVSSFSHGESSRKKATKRNSTKNGVSKSKNKANNLSCAPAEWVEPKSCASLPKDAGKRRVQASGQSAGHWYTSPEGRKVYVNKSGQELTGKGAYRQYRKESGAGFKKSRKKTGAKKTNAKKRN
ncbi:hypothetical protein E2542_SST21726 [Spatholobus suberectus]|nr:hypothetical protein E2542_SST21726 [Spatholobus suberectus]